MLEGGAVGQDCPRAHEARELLLNCRQCFATGRQPETLYPQGVHVRGVGLACEPAQVRLRLWVEGRKAQQHRRRRRDVAGEADWRPATSVASAHMETEP